MTYDLAGKRVFVAGHRGMVGSAVVRRLASEGCEVLTAGRDTLDLKDQAGVRAWMAEHRPDAVVLAAAKVGGILANHTYPADFLYDNLVIETNVIEAAFRNDVGKLLFLGSSCIYPKLAPQPIPEDALLTGPLERADDRRADESPVARHVDARPGAQHVGRTRLSHSAPSSSRRGRR